MKMTRTIHRSLLLVLTLFLSCCHVVKAQDFYKDYKKYLIGDGHGIKKRMPLIDTSIKRLRMTINRFEHDYNKSFFLTDTIFMIDFYGSESGSISKIIWTKFACCFYEYDYDHDNPEKNRKKLIINTDAFDILKYFNYDFRYSIEKIDTAAYTKYADSHEVFDGVGVSPVVAIKTGNHWQFTKLKGNGWAIDYDRPLNKPDLNSNTSTIINDLSKKNFGLNIDSAIVAYRNDTSKFKRQPPYPVITLNGKEINYTQLKSIKPYQIKTISAWAKNSHNPVIPNGVDSKFGVIEITTMDKSN